MMSCAIQRTRGALCRVPVHKQHLSRPRVPNPTPLFSAAQADAMGLNPDDAQTSAPSTSPRINPSAGVQLPHASLLLLRQQLMMACMHYPCTQPSWMCWISTVRQSGCFAQLLALSLAAKSSCASSKVCAPGWNHVVCWMSNTQLAAPDNGNKALTLPVGYRQDSLEEHSGSAQAGWPQLSRRGAAHSRVCGHGVHHSGACRGCVGAQSRCACQMLAFMHAPRSVQLCFAWCTHRSQPAHPLVTQFVREFAKLGLTRSVGGVLALALSRELTPVVTAIILAGRVGSAFAAELGTMQVCTARLTSGRLWFGLLLCTLP